MSFKEKRRFTRAQVAAELGELTPALAAQVTWSNGEVSDLQDLSYKGAAVRRPSDLTFNPDTSVTVELRLGIMLPFKLAARVAWTKLEWLGLEFQSLPPEGHQAMAEYLDAKLIGTNLKPVGSALYSSKKDFSHWYQAPEGVHVFVWTNPEHLVSKVQVDMPDNSSVHFTRQESLPLAVDRSRRKALLILSQMDKPGLPMEEFLRTLAHGA